MRKLMYTAMLVAGLATLGLVPTASAFSGEYSRFNFCPTGDATVNKCLYSVTNSGTVVLGKKTVPIVNKTTVQGGYSKPNGEGFSSFVGATNGVTLSKTPQPVPGGLAGLVNCKEISDFFLRIACEGVFENGLTGVNSTLELARPASEIKVSEVNLAGEEGIALKLPVKVHLENPFLGSTCYVGSSTSPIIWNLTTGATAPPLPNKSIHGASGTLAFKGDDGEIAELTGTELVDNAWSAPGASGCGGFPAELLLNPIINGTVGVPAAAGKNTAILKNTIDFARKVAVLAHP